MSRPKDADSSKTVDSLIEAALEILAESGDPNGLSMRAVADRAGISKSTIGYYFGSKDELLEACLDGYYARLAALGGRLLREAGETDAGLEFIEAGVLELYRFVRRERASIALRLSTNTLRGELHPRRQVEFLGHLVHHAAEWLAPHVEVDAFDVRLSVQAVASIAARFALMTDDEVEVMAGVAGDEGRKAIEGFVVRAARRLVRPSDG